MLARNAAVFNHPLALLLQRDSARAGFGITSQLRLWRFLCGQSPGDPAWREPSTRNHRPPSPGSSPGRYRREPSCPLLARC